MPHSVLTRGRKMVARLTALAMVASIMVVGALPASAAVVDTSATCPSSTPSAGFVDIAAYSAAQQLAINCLVDYGISVGTSATTYSPQMDVSRWQMALFLTRQAEVHGLTLGDGSDQGFTDIAAYPAATQKAINQLHQLGITVGTSATTYSPADPVSRWQMALFLTRLLDEAGYTLGSGASQGFTDIGAYPAATQTAINQIAQAGVSEGFTATTFGPGQITSRVQMALFLTRTLAADGIVPQGFTISVEPSSPLTSAGGVVTVTLVDEGGPVEGQRVEVFVASSFAANGTPTLSSTDTVDGEAATGADLIIDVLDPVTDVDGTIELDLATTNGTPHTVTVVAFYGTVGTTYAAAAAANKVQVQVVWQAGVHNWRITSSDDPTGDTDAVDNYIWTDSYAPYGQAQSFTVQLLDNGTPPGASAVQAKLFILRYIYVDGDLVAQNSETVMTGVNGSYTEAHTFNDPAVAAGNETIAYIYVYFDVDGDGNFTEHAYAYAELVWDDTVSAPDNVALTTTNADMDGFSAVTAKVTDQFGDPVNGVLVRFTRELGLDTQIRTTNASGVASWTIGGPGDNTVAAAGDEAITVEVDGNLTTAGWQAGGDTDAGVVIWYDAAPAALFNTDPSATVTYVDHSASADTVLGSYGGGYWLFGYVASDQYNDGAPASISDFEAFLAGATSGVTTFDVYYDRETTINPATLSAWDF